MSGAKVPAVSPTPAERFFAAALVRARRRKRTPPPYSVCLGCQCTERDCARCIKLTGAPCWWVRSNLCSACRDARGIDDAKLAELVAALGNGTPSQLATGLGGAS